MLVIYVSGGLRSSESDVGRGPVGVLMWALMEVVWAWQRRVL